MTAENQDKNVDKKNLVEPLVLFLIATPLRCLVGLILVVVVLSACEDVNRWESVHELVSQTSPAVSGHDDGRLYLAAVDTGGVLRHTTSLKPEVWAAWEPLSIAPPGGFDPTTAPVLRSVGNRLHAYARGADDNLYHTAKVGTNAWDPWTALIGDGTVKGRISVAITRAAFTPLQETHVAHVTDLGSRYIRLVASTPAATRDWAGAIEGVVEGNGNNEVVVSLRFPEQVVFESASRATGWEFGQPRALSRSAFELSNLVHFDDAYHLALPYRRLIDDVSMSYQHLLLHAWFVPSDGSIELRDVDAYEPNDSVHPKPTLVLYRNKLLAAWSAPNGEMRATRWDDADPQKPWVAVGSLGSGSSEFRPAVAAFNSRPLPLQEYGLPNYGDDAFAAVAGKEGDGQIEFINMSRAMMRIDIIREFTLYNSRSDLLDPTCRKPSDPFGPVMTGPWQEERPILTEIGYNLWVFPDWFVRNLYSDFTVFMCGSGGIWGSTDTPCFRDRLPVYIKMQGGIFNCGGAWINQDNSFIRVWEELGHYMAPALGIGSAIAPNQETADRTGIPLPVLDEGYDLFQERTGTCGSPSPRCPGFTGFSGNYDTDGREHSFIYTVHLYLNNGDQLRQFIQEDLADGDDLLARKYNWVQDNIFRGVEF